MSDPPNHSGTRLSGHSERLTAHANALTVDLSQAGVTDSAAPSRRRAAQLARFRTLISSSAK